MEVVYTASRNLYPYLMASVQSLIEHNPDARVWLLVEDEKLPYEVPQNVEVVDVSGQNIFGPDCVNRRTDFTYLALIRAAYSKLFTGAQNGCGVKKLPKLDRIMQLDVDTIVCDSLEPVWETDLDGKWFAAVPDFPADYRPWGRKKYYNVGLCLFNLEQIRKDKADEKAVEMLNTVPMQYIDEMAWNKLNNDSGDRMGADLPPRYNQTSEVEQTLDCAVAHYAGVKEWWKDFGNMYRPVYMMRYAKFFQNGAELELPALNWIFNIRENGRVYYMMENGQFPVLAEMGFLDAMQFVRGKEMRTNNRFPGFPLTVDGVYFFDGEAERI